jgi:preprotein translocase subunit SecF
MNLVTFINKYLSRYADLGGMVLFVMLVYYFYNIPEKDNFEWVLFVGSIFGLINDTIFITAFLIS